MQNKNQIWREQKIKKRKIERQKSGKILWFFVGLFFLAAAFYLLVFSPFFKIKKVFVKCASARIEADALIKTEDFLKRKVCWILPMDSAIVFRLNKKKAAQIIGGSGEFQVAKLGLKRIRNLEVEVLERDSALNWCIDENCKVLGSDAFEISTGLVDSLPIVIDKCNGRHYEKEKIAFISEINQLILEKTDLKIKSYHLDECATQKLTAKIAVAEVSNFEIYFNLLYSAEEQINILNSVLRKISYPVNLEYVDLQVEGKVFFK
ncbi:MAG: hypothetical protein V1698_01870 [bacterium]